MDGVERGSALSQETIGTVVFGGMLASTLLAVPFVPVFYVLMQSLSEWRGKSQPPSPPGPEPEKPANGEVAKSDCQPL